MMKVLLPNKCGMWCLKSVIDEYLLSVYILKTKRDQALQEVTGRQATIVWICDQSKTLMHVEFDKALNHTAAMHVF